MSELQRIHARQDEIMARADVIERTAPESGTGPLWREYERLMAEYDRLTAAHNVIVRLGR